MKEHAAAGAEIVASVEGLEPIVAWIRHSHERMDGRGYPDGLAGDAIPQASRILLVADAFDAMTSDRTYRRALSHDTALEELRRHAGTQFDPLCVTALEEHLATIAA
jgi:HD-GYP domain-containing protein (c-di-GMP phosphodiesterase class II)